MNQTSIDIGDRNQEEVIPLAWSGWDDVDAFCFQYYDVIFTGDFGPITEGTHCETVYVNFDVGVLETYDGDGNVLSTVKFKAQAIEENG